MSAHAKISKGGVSGDCGCVCLYWLRESNVCTLTKRIFLSFCVLVSLLAAADPFPLGRWTDQWGNFDANAASTRSWAFFPVSHQRDKKILVPNIQNSLDV